MSGMLLSHACVAGLHKSDQQYLRSAKAKAKKPNEEFLYATTASKRAERQRLVRFIRSVMPLQRVTHHDICMPMKASNTPSGRRVHAVKV